MVVLATDSQRYCLRRKGGRSLIEQPPVFSADGLSLLVTCESTVRVYNIKTAECSHVLEPETGGGRLVAVGFHADEPDNLYGCSEGGIVTVWTGRAILRETKLQIPPESEVLTFNLLDCNECFVTTCKNQNKPQLTKYCLKSGDVLNEYEAEIEYSKIWQVAVGWNNKDRFAAICDGTARLWVCDLSRPLGLSKPFDNYNKIRIVCLATHPTGNCMVVGDALGRATLITGELFNQRELAREVLHWHTLPVITAAFSPHGGYLVTGGVERVAVKWHLGSSAGAAQQRDVLPRLPGTLRHIVVSTQYIAISTTSNSIVITTPQLSVVSTITECGGLSSKTRALNTGLVYHRPLGALLLGGRTGHLQLFSITTDKLLYNVDITGFNKIPSSRLNPNPADTEVACAAVGADGQWLVTSEYRSDGVTYPEERLKFWAFTANSSNPFSLNTCVNLSHGGCSIISIAINNTSTFCVTAGTDQKFRIWKREANVQNNVKRISWRCLTACYYAPGVGASLDQWPSSVRSQMSEDDFTALYLRQKNDNDFISAILGVGTNVKKDNDVGSMRTNEAIEADLEMGGVAISQDGSLIAAWFGCKLTLWDSHTCTLRSTLSHPSLRPKGVDVCFGNDDAAHYVVCTTQHCVAAWSLLSLSVRWLVHARPVTLAPDPFSNRIAVVTDNNDVFVFTPHQSAPLLSRRAVLDARSGVLRHCAFGPSSFNDYRLYFMRNDSEIYSLEPAGTSAAPLESVSRVTLPVSNFGALLATQQTSGVQRMEAALVQTAEAKSPVSLFSAASHMLPSVALLCTSFLQQLSGAAVAEDSSEHVQTVSDESSSDEESESEGAKPAAEQVEFWKPNYKDTKEKRVRKILGQPTLSLHKLKSILE